MRSSRYPTTMKNSPPTTPPAMSDSISGEAPSGRMRFSCTATKVMPKAKKPYQNARTTLCSLSGLSSITPARSALPNPFGGS